MEEDGEMLLLCRGASGGDFDVEFPALGVLDALIVWPLAR